MFKEPRPQGESPRDWPMSVDRAQAEVDSGRASFVKEDHAPYGEAAIKRATIATAARELDERRERWLNPPEWTQTEWLEFRATATASGPWSRFVEANSIDAVTGIGTASYPRSVPRDEKCAAKLKARTLTALYNERPAWLALAHEKLDAAVAAAYGWPANLSDEEILTRLLALNLARAAAEKKGTAGPKRLKPQREKQADELI